MRHREIDRQAAQLDHSEGAAHAVQREVRREDLRDPLGVEAEDLEVDVVTRAPEAGVPLAAADRQRARASGSPRRTGPLRCGAFVRERLRGAICLPLELCNRVGRELSADSDCTRLRRMIATPGGLHCG